jgi:type I restriction enzyme, S subunit
VSGWHDTRLKNLFTSVRNGVWGDEPDEATDVYCARGTDFDRLTGTISDVKMPQRSVAPAALREHQLQRGDLVLEKSGGSEDQPVGSVALFDLPIRAVCSNFNARLQVDHLADSRFVCYLMNGLYWGGFTRQFVKQTTGIQNLDAEALLSQHCRIPPLNEQRRIADFLDAETARIYRLAELQNAVRTTVQARMIAQLDIKFDELTEEYGAMPFRRSIRAIEQGLSPQCDNFPAGPDDWGVLKVSAVKNGVFFEEENKQLPAYIQPEARYEVKQGDLLITRANTPQLVGAVAVAQSPRGKLMLCDKIFRVVTTKELMPQFLVLVSLSTKIRDMCAEASHGTSQSMANLKTEEIKSWPIPQAPVDVQRAVVAGLSAGRTHTKALTDAIDNQLAVLAERRQALITATVTGRITV